MLILERLTIRYKINRKIYSFVFVDVTQQIQEGISELVYSIG